MKFRSNKIWSLLIISVFIIPLCISLSNLQSDGFNKFEIIENIKQSSDCSDIDLSIIPEINYTALNASWYDPKAEMLIVTPDNQTFVDAATPLMNWKNSKGVKTIIARNFTSYPGTDDAEKVRNLILDYYNKENIKWVILAADTDAGETELIPTKTISNPGGGTEHTDFYYADLNSDWSDIDNIDWTAEVYVGRLPANTATELEIMINKIIKYEKNPLIGQWMNRMLLVGAISDTEPEEPPNGEDESRLTTYIAQNYVQTIMNYTHLADYNGRYYTGGYTPAVPFSDLTSGLCDQSFDNGYSMTLFASHGGPTGFQSDGPLGEFYDDTMASNSDNDNKPSLFYADACSTSTYDDELDDKNIGEILIKHQNGGAIGYIGALRDTFYYTEDETFVALNRANAKLFWSEIFQNSKYQQGRAFFDSKVSYWNSEYVQLTFSKETIINPQAHYRNLLTYNLLGDPELDVYTDLPQNVTNPFPVNIYEGQLVSVQLVPYANVHLTTVDGMYHTAHADENGTAKFRLTRGVDIIYNVTITGHNYIPTNFSFVTLQDNTDPTPDFDYTPQAPSTFDNMCFNAFTDEAMSGIESIYLFTSLDGFDNYATYSLTNDFLENVTNLEINLTKFIPGLYEYSIHVVARDYANNTKSVTHYFSISIPLTSTDFLLVGALIMIISFTGLSILVIRKGTLRYSEILKRIEE